MRGATCAIFIMTLFSPRIRTSAVRLCSAQLRQEWFQQGCLIQPLYRAHNGLLPRRRKGQYWPRATLAFGEAELYPRSESVFARHRLPLHSCDAVIPAARASALACTKPS